MCTCHLPLRWISFEVIPTHAAIVGVEYSAFHWTRNARWEFSTPRMEFLRSSRRPWPHLGSPKRGTSLADTSWNCEGQCSSVVARMGCELGWWWCRWFRICAWLAGNCHTAWQLAREQNFTYTLDMSCNVAMMWMYVCSRTKYLVHILSRKETYITG